MTLGLSPAQIERLLDDVPVTLPALTRALKLQKKASSVGFDWPDLEPVVGKVHEEIDEVLAEINAQQVDQDAVEDEIGDLLFAVVNLARHAKVNPEIALLKASKKFETRFRKVEDYMQQQGSSSPDIEIRKLTFTPGYREKFWQNNCIAIGLSAGFVEPLEASSLALVELSADMLASQFPHNKQAMPLLAKRFNQTFLYRWQRVIDFLKLHYYLNLW